VTFHCKSGRGIPLGNIEVPYASPRGNQTSRTSEGLRLSQMDGPNPKLFLLQDAPFPRYRLGKVFLNNGKPHKHTLRVFPSPTNDVTTTACGRLGYAMAAMTNTLAPPQPARLTRSTPGLLWMIKRVIPDFSTVTLFHVRQLGTKIFPKNLGHAHKVN
jgi:hypothetical protein